MDLNNKQMRNLINSLNNANYYYYNTGVPIMSDAEYDKRFEALQRLEKETGITLSNSPTINVGTTTLNYLPEVTHNHLMLSLDKCHSARELTNFIKGKNMCISVKADGLTVSIMYKNGELVSAETRGNGEKGNDITEHIKQFKNIPLHISKKGTYIVDGEAIIHYHDFKTINKTGEFKNPRNLAAGTLASLDTKIVKERKLSFLVWDVIEGGRSNSMTDNLNEALELGFDTVYFVSLKKKDLSETEINNENEAVIKAAEICETPCDGVVWKYDDIAYGKSLGKTGHHFNNGIAWKPKDIDAETSLLNIEWTMGKTGSLCPTAVFETIELEGTEVSRASLHNISVMNSLLGTPYEGQKITVYKANQIIPQIRNSVKKENPENAFEVPRKCPICGGRTTTINDNGTDVLICCSPDCQGKLLGKLVHFCSKNAMDIKGMSEETIKKFMDKKWLNSFEDIYNLSQHKRDIINMPGFGTQSAKNIFKAIESSKECSLDRFIYSLSIPLIGRTASKEIAKHFKYEFCAFWDAVINGYNWLVLPNFGSEMNNSIKKYFTTERKAEISNLARYMKFKEVDKAKENNSINLSGKIFVVTGKVNHFKNREEVKELIESLGGKVTGSVTKKTSYLINNDVNSTSGKNKKAKELGVQIISENEFLEMVR